MSYFYELPAPIILIVEGKDAPRYMNARLTNDIKTLAQGASITAAALNPQGRTQGFFRITRLEDQKFLLLCDGGDAAAVIAAFRKYIVADRVTVSDISATHAVTHITGPLPSLPNDAIVLSARRMAVLGHDVVTSRDQQEGLRASLSASRELGASEYMAERISAGVPSFPEELNESSLFSEAELRDAVSFRKGCYVGQEVVEKVDALGRVARRLRVVRLPGDVTVEKEAAVSLADGSKPVGEVLSAAHLARDGATYLFTTMKNMPESEIGVKVTVSGSIGEIIQ